MVLHSRWEVPIPNCSLHKWVFCSSLGPLPDTPLFIDADHPETRIITRSGYRLWSKRIALGLLRAGLKKGDRVLLFSGNNIFLPTIFMGTLMAGGVFSGANPSFVARELAYQIQDSGAYILIAADASMEIAMEAAEQAGLPKSRVYSFDATAMDKQKGEARLGSQHWTNLLASEADAAKWDWEEPLPKETTCCLNYSSGTTGVPKGVEISHYSYVANGAHVDYVDRLEPRALFKRKSYRHLCFLPCYHAYGQTYFLANIPHVGAPVYMMPSFNFEKMLQHIQRFRITHITAVPPIIVMLAKSPLSRKYDLSSIQAVGSGAAPLGLEVSDEAAKIWPTGAITVRQGWGMTELTCTVTNWDPNEPKRRTAAIGELMPNCKARLMKTDGSGEVTAPNERGELWVASPTLMKGYWKRPDATADTMHVDPDGTRWMKTGDVAYIEKYESGGKLFIVDRIKELIKVKGNQVAPAELEALLLDHAAVADAGVVGVTINGEEVPRAYIVPKPDAKVTEKDIAEWLATRVISYKRLRGGVSFADAIPRNPSGKIQRRQLRDLAAKQVGDRKPTESRLA
ncbi:AMP-binding enzyme [Xylaria bambusicola]|uniref:AMP-binding enzyme n=1 Tax=Xylaria bambusicola TaxID=326684 RepID=UPI002007D6FC|nr:AMP-binding enzyme [Xylaria bambusicola]KAI0528224.1 AMP-binding enzyme [Xylaria bambusicola]